MPGSEEEGKWISSTQEVSEVRTEAQRESKEKSITEDERNGQRSHLSESGLTVW